jgi:hypothetical protein
MTFSPKIVTPWFRILLYNKSIDEESIESKTVHRGADHPVLKEGEVGAKAADLCRKYGMSEPTYTTGSLNTPGSPSTSLKD